MVEANADRLARRFAKNPDELYSIAAPALVMATLAIDRDAAHHWVAQAQHVHSAGAIVESELAASLRALGAVK
jgi:hypothetical protein